MEISRSTDNPHFKKIFIAPKILWILELVRVNGATQGL